MSIFTMARALSVDGNLFHVTHRRRSSSLGARTTPDRASCILNRENTFCTDCIGCLNTSIRENLDVSRTSDGLPAIGHVIISAWNYTKLTILSAYNQKYYLSHFMQLQNPVNPLNAELNPICHLLALLGVHHFLHISRIRVKSLTLRLTYLLHGAESFLRS